MEDTNELLSVLLSKLRQLTWSDDRLMEREIRKEFKDFLHVFAIKCEIEVLEFRFEEGKVLPLFEAGDNKYPDIRSWTDKEFTYIKSRMLDEENDVLYSNYARLILFGRHPVLKNEIEEICNKLMLIMGDQQQHTYTKRLLLNDIVYLVLSRAGFLTPKLNSLVENLINDFHWVREIIGMSKKQLRFLSLENIAIIGKQCRIEFRRLYNSQDYNLHRHQEEVIQFKKSLKILTKVDEVLLAFAYYKSSEFSGSTDFGKSMLLRQCISVLRTLRYKNLILKVTSQLEYVRKNLPMNEISSAVDVTSYVQEQRKFASKIDFGNYLKILSVIQFWPKLDDKIPVDLLDLVTVEHVDEYGTLNYHGNKESKKYTKLSHQLQELAFKHTIMFVEYFKAQSNKYTFYDHFGNSWMMYPISKLLNRQENLGAFYDLIREPLKLYAVSDLAILSNNSQLIIDSLAPKFELALRLLCLGAGRTITKRGDFGDEYIKLTELLDNVKDFIDPLDVFLISTILNEKYSFNIRNEVCHGLMFTDKYSALKSTMLIWLLLRLSKYSIT